MAHSVYLASMEPEAGKSTIALGLLNLLNKSVTRTGVFRPVIRSSRKRDKVLDLLLSSVPGLSYDDCVGVTYDELNENSETAMARIIEKFRALERLVDMIVVVGSDYADVASPVELAQNSKIAANLGSAVILIVNAKGHPTEEVARSARLAIEDIRSYHANVVGVITNRAEESDVAKYNDELFKLGLPAWTLPEIPVLAAPTVAEIRDALGATLVYGEEALLAREAEHLLLGGMNVEHILERLKEGQLVIAASDRPEILITLIAAHAAESFPSLAGVVLNGGYAVPQSVERLVLGFGQKLPILAAPHDSFTTARLASRTRGALTPFTERKQELAIATFEKYVPAETILNEVDFRRSDVVTPLMFEAELLERARSAKKHIVLPEGDDDRVLRAASTLLSRDVTKLTILGDEFAVRARAAELGLSIADATILSPNDEKLIDLFANEYARLRAAKGMDVERAREIVRDVSYFGTMMVHLGLADGMVSGALHTTAHTIKPSFEIIKTKPGASIVSSVFLMLMEDRVLVYGDCAVNPDPTAAQLADIAISSAETAAQFGVDPRVAMLSYSTGGSGSGADVDKVREATALAKERAPHLLIEGPIQYDAAVDPAVAATKLPGSDVAGRATVLIFPDLNTGNNTYKAVQRSAGAVAVGPVLQGLNKPVNDLSRGALVHDIVNTVAITAIQAAGQQS